MKKIIALVLAMALVLASCAVAFADGEENLGAPFLGDTHSDSTFVAVNDGSVAVTGLDVGDTVYFYKVLAFDQDADGTIENIPDSNGWKVVDPFLTAPNALTDDDLQAILTTGIDSDLAAKIGKNATDTTKAAFYAEAVASGDTAVASHDAEAGLYVAMVVPAAAGWTYNPIFVASDYYKTGSSSQSSVWNIGTGLSYSNRAVVKKSPITVIKTAEEHENAVNEERTARAAGVGDVIDYKIETKVPQFAKNYTNPVFVITDTLTEGLSFNKDITVTGIDASYYEITYPEGTAFKITFIPSELLKITEPTDIVIRYSATVDHDAITNVNEEDNTVTVEYSHEPSVIKEGDGKKVGDRTHHYTFTIDGNVWGNTGYQNSELVKVGLDKNGNEITTQVPLDSGNTVGALENAVFRLYTDEECKNEYNKGTDKNGHKKDTFSSDAQGQILIEGLDAGEYWLLETQAPAGYIRQQDPVHIKIEAEFYDEVTWTETIDGEEVSITSGDILKGYKVYIDNILTGEYTLKYEMNNGLPVNDKVISGGENGFMATHNDIVVGNEGPIKVNDPKINEESYGKIKNTQGTELPSTGGIGTTIFYILGGLLVIGAAVILVARRKAQD